jgi:hypothetical protein
MNLEKQEYKIMFPNFICRGCSQKGLARSIEVHMIAIQEGWAITEKSLQFDSQFLSDDVNKDENFNTFIDSEKFKRLCAEGKKLEGKLPKEEVKGKVTDFVNTCENVFFEKDQDNIVKAQVHILLEHVILIFKKVKETGKRFHFYDIY